MPHSRHTHSHSRTAHVGPSGALAPQSRTSSTTSLGSNKRSVSATAAAGLGFTQVVNSNNKKKNDARPHGPYRNVSAEGDTSRGRSKHAATQSQLTIAPQQVAGATSSRHKQSRSTSQTHKPKFQTNGDDDDDEWVSSSGADTPSTTNNETEDEEDSEDGRMRKAMLIRDSLQRQSREREAVGTPRAAAMDDSVFFRRSGNGKEATPPPLGRTDTQRTIHIPPAPQDTPLTPPAITTSTVIPIPARTERPRPPSPARSQPDPQRSPISPHPTRSKAKTRPPSIRSTTSQHYAQPHPLIRGSSFHNKAEPLQTGGLGGIDGLAPLTSIKAPPIVTSNYSSGLRASESPTEMESSMNGLGLGSPTSISTATTKSGRRTSQSSVASVATLPAGGNTPNNRASFIISPAESTFNPPRERERNRTMSTASTVSLNKAISHLARHSPHGAAQQPPPSRSNWHFPNLPSLGLTYSPAPTRPSTPPPLSCTLPPARYQSNDNDGGRRYRNYIRRKHAQSFNEPDEEEDFEGELEDERGEEGVGEWIPQPFFGEHLTAIRWAVRSGHSGKGSEPEGILRQSWRRVCAARAGAGLPSY